MTYETTIIQGLVAFGIRAHTACADHIPTHRAFSDPKCGAIWWLATQLANEDRLPRSAQTILYEEAGIRSSEVVSDGSASILQYVGREWLDALTQGSRTKLDEVRVAAEFVSQAYLQRLTVGMVKHHLAMIERPGADAGFVAAQLIEKLKTLSHGSQHMGAHDAAAQYLAESARIHGADGTMSWGIPLADRVCPIMPGIVVTLSAPPGGGKTALSTQVLHHSAGNGVRCAFITMEMTPGRLVARYTNRFVDYDADPDARAKLYLASPLRNLQYVTGTQTPTSIARELRALAMEGTQLVAIDYVQKVRADDAKHSTYDTIGRAADMIADIAKETGMAILLLSQQSRDGRRQARNKSGRIESNPEPQMSDLKGSGSLEENTDTAVGLWQPEPSETTVVHIRLKVMKNRYGPDGRFVRCEFDRARGIIRDETPAPPPEGTKHERYQQEPSNDEDLFA